MTFKSAQSVICFRGMRREVTWFLQILSERSANRRLEQQRIVYI